MEFGRIPDKDLAHLNVKLPPDPAANKIVLADAAGNGSVFFGCAKWGRRDWVGKLYPTGTPEKDFLTHYGLHYDTIELNATHYKMYSPAHLISWAKKVNNPSFRFCPKAHRGMSFLKASPTRDRITRDFIKNIRALKKNLGPVFITHDEKLKWDDQAEKEFFAYLSKFPSGIPLFVEERSAAFFSNRALRERYFDRLRALGVGSVITDTAGRRDVLHMNLTIPKTFIRFVGNSLHPSDYPRIDNWAKRIRKWLDAGIEEVYFFMHMHDEGKSPELTEYVVKSFNKYAKLQLPEVNLL